MIEPCSNNKPAMREEMMPPVHPGEILLEDFMKPTGITQYRLAKAMSVYLRKV